MSKARHYSEQEFEQLVGAALDELPAEFQRALKDVAVVVSDRGAENHAYGMYVGSRLGGNPFFGGGGLPDEILAGAPKGYTDAVLDDEFPLSMFFEALDKKTRPIVDSTVGITGRDA